MQIFGIVALGRNVDVQCLQNDKIDRWMATGSLKRKEAEVTNNEEIDRESGASTSHKKILINPHKKKKKRRVKRKYYESYLALGIQLHWPRRQAVVRLRLLLRGIG